MIDLIRLAVDNPFNSPMTVPEIIEEEIKEYKASGKYQTMVMADAYYRNRSDVQNKTNTIAKRSNTKIEHPILKKMVEQKVNYLLSKPFSAESKSENYQELLNDLFDENFRKKIKSFGKYAIKHGIAFLQPYFDENMLAWMKIPATELIPIFEDFEGEKLHSFIRFYDQVVYEGKKKTIVTKAEFWTIDGVERFSKKGDAKFVPDGAKEPHFFVNGKAYNWATPPLVWCRYNEEEMALLDSIKDLIDDINWQTSVTADVLRDVAKFIFILRNYSGSDIAEFVKDLQEALAIKIDSDGGVDKLQADLNIDAVMAFLDKQRRDVYDYGSGVDVKDKELGNSSGTAINFRYMDLDNDCAGLGAELKSAFERMKIFIDTYLQIAGKGDFTDENFTVTFNADMPVNETDIIANARNSVGLVSNRTILANHPWVDDITEEEEQMKKEKEEALESLGEGMFGELGDDEQGVLEGKGTQAGSSSE